ncbi:MAG: hypothetical protein JJU31_07585 [Wenzhouxiangella sp.]|nr:hypothetical protein [Wenzhouxiangella sp.]TVR95776.1 MAG: hypothetical protein EA418_06890 [Wenzhouxiangellaceae bacterium]
MQPAIRAALTLVAMMLMASSQAQVYRCDIDGVSIFADSPCAADARIYQSEARLSVIPAAADLDQVAIANQAFIQARLDAIAADRQQRRDSTDLHTQQPPEQPLATPVLVVPRTMHHGRGYYRPRPRPDDEAVPAKPGFSALSGPFPGTRRGRR